MVQYIPRQQDLDRSESPPVMEHIHAQFSTGTFYEMRFCDGCKSRVVSRIAVSSSTLAACVWCSSNLSLQVHDTGACTRSSAVVAVVSGGGGVVYSELVCKPTVVFTIKPLFVFLMGCAQ